MAQFYGNKVKGSSLSELQCIMAGQTYISWKENDVAAWQGTVSCTTWLVHFAITGILIQFYFWSKQTIAEAVGDWFFNRREVKEIDCEYPCNPTCYNTVLSRPYKEAWQRFPLYHFGDFQHTLHLVIADFFFRGNTVSLELIHTCTWPLLKYTNRRFAPEKQQISVSIDLFVLYNWYWYLCLTWQGLSLVLETGEEVDEAIPVLHLWKCWLMPYNVHLSAAKAWFFSLEHGKLFAGLGTAINHHVRSPWIIKLYCPNYH
jgi:hypothetical protein